MVARLVGARALTHCALSADRIRLLGKPEHRLERVLLVGGLDPVARDAEHRVAVARRPLCLLLELGEPLLQLPLVLRTLAQLVFEMAVRLGELRRVLTELLRYPLGNSRWLGRRRPLSLGRESRFFLLCLARGLRCLTLPSGRRRSAVRPRRS